MNTKTIDEIYALTPMQQGMLFHSLYDMKSGINVEQIVCKLKEDLNLLAFRQAWEQVIERHSIFRTSFRWEAMKEPVQDVHKQVKLVIDEQDWRDLSTIEKEKRMENYLRSDRRLGFDMTQAPIMRFGLFRIQDADYQFVWSCHHALLDGRSITLVLKETFDRYDAICRGEELKRKTLRPFREYVEWRQRKDMSEAERFWRLRLEGFTAPTSLGAGREGNQLTNLEEDHGEQEIRLSVDDTSALRSLAERYQLTLSTLVQGAWALLLNRYSGEEDIVFGVTRACRQSALEGAESMVGILINTLPTRVRVASEKSVVTWLKEIRNEQIAQREYEHTPLIDIQKWSDVPGGRSLFDSIIVFDHSLINSILRMQRESWQNREFSLIEKTNYPITVYSYGEPKLLLKIAYDRRQFGDAVISRILGHVKTLLKNMVSNPNQRLGELTLLTKTERHKLLIEWNETRVEYNKDVCIHQSIEKQAEERPDSVAVVFKDKQLTYRELNNRANQLAHDLQRKGVGPDVLVGIYMDRSLEMIVGLLGILKAGGAYVPLDPSYPKDRITFMIEDSRLPLILTQPWLEQNLPEHQAQVVCLESTWESISHEDNTSLQSAVTAKNLAYVIYTSGSTGKPKGVMVEHRNVVSFFTGMDDRIEHELPGVWLAVTSISFDISVLELFWTLARGFKVVIQLEDDISLASSAPQRHDADQKRVDFSLMYFAADERQDSTDKYRLLFEGAKFADQHGFCAVWTPERHFHAFGGLYPNPSVYRTK